jgi:hypothetical protein
MDVGNLRVVLKTYIEVMMWSIMADRHEAREVEILTGKQQEGLVDIRV